MKTKRYIITIEITGVTLQDIYDDLQQLLNEEPDFSHLKQRVPELIIDSEDEEL